MTIEKDDTVAMGGNFDKYEGVEHKDQGEVLCIADGGEYAMVKFFQIEKPISVLTSDLIKLTEYHVTIKASVTKTEGVFAESVDEAEEMAHQQFSILNDDNDERYEQETVNCEEAEA